MLSWFKWLYPGLKVKRWLFLAFCGLLLLIAGLSVLDDAALLGVLLKAVVKVTYSYWGSPFSWWTGLLLMSLGVIFVVLGFKNVINSLFNTLLPENEDRLVEIIYQRRSLKKGPKVVAIGGGTGLPNMLRGLKVYTSNITAIVTVADDGGSSGRLRGEFGILAPGDIRNCLVALADTETLLERVLNYRFDQGEGLAGHSMGNLLLAALIDLTGSFEQSIRELSRVLAIRGKVLPATLDYAVLSAEFADGSIVEGESNIPKVGKKIKRVFLSPDSCSALPQAVEAIREAEVVVLGPGSLYTSIIPNLLVKDIADALRETKAPIIYVCNIMTQPGETEACTAAGHLRAIIEHLGEGIVDYIVVNTGSIPNSLLKKYSVEGSRPVLVDKRTIEKMGVKVIGDKLVNSVDFIRHDQDRLARLIIKKTFWKRKI
ncbi:YvcK family protein [Bacillota bacterium LX-D]|nr:YvcK family protein [Bacillota bacterium LX-D]